MLIALILACSDNGVTKFNSEPYALITEPRDGDVITEGDDTVLRGAVSDPDNASDELAATWYVGDRVACEEAAPDEAGVTTCTTALSLGDHAITLDVRDRGNATSSDSIGVTVLPGDVPLAHILAPLGDVPLYSDHKITFQGEVSYTDTDPATLVATWTSDLDGALTDIATTPDGAGHVLGFAYLSEGEHALTLHVVAPDGRSGDDSVIVEVGPPNTSPSCAITAPASGSAGEAGQSVLFEAQVSDPDLAANLLDVTWTSDRDGLLTTSTPTSQGYVAFATSALGVGTHAITLTATDEVGGSCTDLVLYTVGTAPALTIDSPAANAVYGEGDPIAFAATVSDAEDAVTTIAVAFGSDIDGMIGLPATDGSGVAQFVRDDLSIGAHVLTVTATDPAGLYTTRQLSFTVNGAPSAPIVAITPDPPAGDDALTAAITSPSVDPDGDPVSYAYAWYQNGVLSAASTSSVLPASATSRGDTWRVVVTPTDGVSDGPTGEDTVVVGDTAPAIASVVLSPSPADTNSVLALAIGASDADGDALSYTYAWEVDGVAIAATTATLDGSTWFDEGQQVQAFVTASDGSASVGPVASNIVDVQNAAPTLVVESPLANSTTAEGDPIAFRARVSDAEDAPGAITVSFTSDLDGNLGTPTPDGAGVAQFVRSDLSAGDQVLTVTATDTGGLYATVLVPFAVQGNAPPVIASVTVSPDPATTNSLLTVAISASDADGDPLSYAYDWHVDGASIGVTTATLSGATRFDEGQQVQVFVTASDGTASAGPTASNLVDVVNTPPTAPVAVITPAAPVEQADDLLCSVATPSSDADGDPIAYVITWTVDGAPYPTDTGQAGPQTTNLVDDTVPASDTTAGEVWRCTVTPWDDDGPGSADVDSVTVRGAAFVYDGIYDVTPTIAYTCKYFGIPVVSFSINAFTLADSGSALLVDGTPNDPKQLRDAPTPTNGSFSASGTKTGGCDETYTLTGTFTDADHWAGTYSAEYVGAQCAQTTCTNQSWAVSATRQ
jgi:hypothetical protein